MIEENTRMDIFGISFIFQAQASYRENQNTHCHMKDLEMMARASVETTIRVRSLKPVPLRASFEKLTEAEHDCHITAEPQTRNWRF